MKKQTHNLLISVLFFLAAFCFWYTTAASSLAAKRAGFTLHSHSITVGDVTKYQITGLEKKQSVQFFCSNTNLATIQKKTGKLTAKRAGMVTISAKIYNKKGKKINTLKTKLTILEKTILPNASFKVNGSINPWNFQIQLSCSRILLESEVDKSSLTIISKTNKNKKISAAFCNLSTNGKEITYSIPNASQKILCPGDTSMNGTYQITSSIFQKPLSISYQERIAADTISGFVLQNNGNPVQDALVRINTVSAVMETTTNDTGHYQIKNIKNPSSMSVTKDGYQSQSLTSFSSARKGVLCENFILKKNSKNTALECIVTDEENIPVPDAAVTLALEKNDSKEDSILCQATTDSNGTVTFDNYPSVENLQNTDCSIIYPNAEKQLSYASSYSFSTDNRHMVNSGEFSPAASIAIYVSKNTMDFDTSIHYETQKCQLSFQHLMNNHASLRVSLKKITYLPLQSLSVKWDSNYSPDDCHSLSLSLYHRTQKKPVFQRLLLANEFSMGTMQKSQNTILTILSEEAFPILPNNSYLIFLSAFNSENRLLAESGLQSCYLQNGCLYITSDSSSLSEENTEEVKEKAVIFLQSPHYVRILLYTDYFTAPDKRMSATFQLYQKKENQYYFLGNFDSDKFSGNVYEPKTASLIISSIFSKENYLIVPSPSSPLSGNYYTIKSANFTAYPNREDAIASQNPSFQIYCNSSNTTSSPIYPDDFYNDSYKENFYTDISNISFQSCCDITQNIIRSCSTYPNSVVAFYQNEGNLIASSLLPRPAHISDVAESDNSPANSSVIDIYTNGELLITNQPSYHK